ncbi:hypothetical protein [Lysobacter gummosus]|uniref:hypothetical protein n=1 Tax=Lysobacter gummosus TaxID=262324 RepID=UPI00364498E8
MIGVGLVTMRRPGSTQPKPRPIAPFEKGGERPAPLTEARRSTARGICFAGGYGLSGGWRKSKSPCPLF